MTPTLTKAAGPAIAEKLQERQELASDVVSEVVAILRSGPAENKMDTFRLKIAHAATVVEELGTEAGQLCLEATQETEVKNTCLEQLNVLSEAPNPSPNPSPNPNNNNPNPKHEGSF